MRIAMLGTRGVPARYGGFESCVEEVGARLCDRGHEVTVYTRKHEEDGESPPASHRGMTIVRLPAVRQRALETLSHTGVSVAHLLPRRRPDAALVFNAANAPFLPLLRARRVPVATHVDGLEWMRAKWDGVGRTYYRRAEELAVRWSDLLIADAQGIADYYEQEFSAQTVKIAYGCAVLADPQATGLSSLGLSTRGYHLVVARFEPENHVDMIVEGYVRSRAKMPLVVVGSAPYAAEYTQRITGLADSRVRLVGAVWDQDLLDQLYANSLTYLHGHSVGGTNPSLLRAIGAGTAVSAFDVVFNREVLDETGWYFANAATVAELVERAENDPEQARRRGLAAQARAVLYDWDDVASRYEELCSRLAKRDFPSRRPSGRRNGLTTLQSTEWVPALDHAQDATL